MANKILWVIVFAYLIVLSVLTYQNRSKTGYIIIEEVYNKFELKKELEKQFNSIKTERKKILDSLELDLKLYDSKLRKMIKVGSEAASLFETKKEVYYQKAKQFEEDNNQTSSQFDKEILMQLNQYVKDYGKEKKYDYIFGNDNNGSLMHATEKNNITSEVVDYINKKYKGLN